MKEILSGCWFSSLFSLPALKCSPEIQPTPWRFPCFTSFKAMSAAFLVAKDQDTGKPRAGDPGCATWCWTAGNHPSLHWSAALDFMYFSVVALRARNGVSRLGFSGSRCWSRIGGARCLEINICERAAWRQDWTEGNVEQWCQPYKQWKTPQGGLEQVLPGRLSLMGWQGQAFICLSLSIIWSRLPPWPWDLTWKRTPKWLGWLLGSEHILHSWASGPSLNGNQIRG